MNVERSKRPSRQSQDGKNKRKKNRKKKICRKNEKKESRKPTFEEQIEIAKMIKKRQDKEEDLIEIRTVEEIVPRC